MKLAQQAAHDAYKAGNVTLGQAMALAAAVYAVESLLTNNARFSAQFRREFGQVGVQCLLELAEDVD